MPNSDLFHLDFSVFRYAYFLMFRKVIQAKYLLMVMPHTKPGSLNEGKKTESLLPEFHRAQIVYSTTSMASLIEYAANIQVSSLVTDILIRGNFLNEFTLYSLP